MRGETDQGLRDMRAAIEVARAEGRDDDVYRAYCNMVDALHAASRSREALEVAAEGLAVAAEADVAVPWLSLELSEVQFDLGDWPAADATSDPDRLGGVAGTTAIFRDLRRADLMLGRGDLDETMRRLERARDAAVRSLEPQWHGPIGALLAEAHRRAGDLDAARAAVAEGLDRVGAEGTQDGRFVARIVAAGASVEADAALLARATGRPADADEAVARLDALLTRGHEAFLCATSDAHPEMAAHLDAAAAEGSRARAEEAAWAAVAAGWDALERPYAAARARWRGAEDRAAVGDRAGAAALADAARATAERLGATWLVDELDGLVRRARLHAPAAEDGGADDPLGLTPREREVLALLAEGRTNREIGAALFMAEKTASVHVSRILAKLDVRSRTEAAAVAHRLVAAHP
jgi:DNA-binding CsgD family transcriptional regulator/antitoxin (DNA-binding transcriptional repressor) of toxin-antitoxin stability system